MEDNNGESIWLNLPNDIMETIADKAGDISTGRALFRSVCRPWRAAVPDTPRLLLPAAQQDGADDPLLFPLSRGWSLAVDVRDTSCHLTHLAAGATAPLPSLNAVRSTAAASSRVVRHGYEHAAAPAATPAGTTPPRHRKNFRVKRSFRVASSAGDRRRRTRSGWKIRMNSSWKSIYLQDPGLSSDDDRFRIKIKYLWYLMLLETDLEFSDLLRLAVHVPPENTPAASTVGIVIMMYHPIQGKTGMVFCRPGDAEWTKIENPIDDDEFRHNLIDFAYFDGKMFAMDRNGTTAAIDADTLEVIDLVGVPPETRNFTSRLFGTVNGDYAVDTVDHLHLLALPSKLLVVRVRVSSSSSVPESFDVFELGQDDDRDGGELEWRKLDGDDVGGNYGLFLDGHHATFSDDGGGGGSRIYYVQSGRSCRPRETAYCYSMRDKQMECLYSLPENCEEQYSTKPSWFVPYICLLLVIVVGNTTDYTVLQM
uniref:KIB1-4 beta-propeller domain-containing protein n=1 Tax=Leersia perrieri TaxID=77586 RepID=A0A0D9XM07_9ORYZ